jgi:hypothetical protein
MSKWTIKIQKSHNPEISKSGIELGTGDDVHRPTYTRVMPDIFLSYTRYMPGYPVGGP